jgi:hypothetical protein
MPFPLNPSPRRSVPKPSDVADADRQIPGPSNRASATPTAPQSAPDRPGDSKPKRPFSGTACGSRSTRPTGTR